MKQALMRTRRMLAMVLSVAMIFAYVPNTVFAYADENDQPISENNIEESTEQTTEEATEPQPEDTEVEDAVEKERLDYTADSTLTISNNAGGGDSHIGLFTVNGYSVQELTSDGTESYDSDRDFVIYAVPDLGYEFKDSVPSKNIKIEGKYQVTGDVTPTTNIDNAYTIGTSFVDLSDASENLTTLGADPRKAIQITFKSSQTSDIAKMFRDKADGTKTFSTDPEIKLTINKDTGKKAYMPVDLIFPDGTRTEIHQAEYGAKIYGTTGIDISAAFGPEKTWTWDQVEGVVAFTDGTKQSTKEGKYILGDRVDASGEIQDDFPNSLDNVNAYYLSAAHELYISTEGVNDAYEKIAKGSTNKLAVVFTLKETQPEKYSVTAATSNYYKLTGDIIKAKIATKGSSGKYVISGNLVTTTGKRKISGVHYTIEGDETIHDFAPVTTAGPGEQAVTAAGEGSYTILQSQVSGNMTIFADTKETIDFKVSQTETNKNDVGLTGFADEDTEATVIGATISAGGSVSEGSATLLTGKPYKFLVTPADGYSVESVTAKIYGVAHNPNGYSETTLVSTGKGYYEIPAATGDVEVYVKGKATTGKTVRTDAASAAKYASLTITDVTTGTLITSTGGPLVSTDADLVFEVEPDTSYSVKKMQYSIGGDDTKYDLTGTTDLKGRTTYTIAKNLLVGPVTLYPEQDAAATSAVVRKLKNPHVTVTLNSSVLGDTKTDADDNYQVVSTASAMSFTLTPVGNATVDKVYYKSSATVPTDATGATELHSTGLNYAISAEELKTGAGYPIYLIVTTKETISDSSYTVTWDGTAKPNKVDPTKGEKTLSKVSLVAGGATALTATTTRKNANGLKNIDVEAGDTITATIYDSKKKVVNSEFNIAYSLGLTDADKKIATVNSSTGAILSDVKNSGTDTLTMTAESKTANAFPHKVVYTATLPVEVKALNTVYGTTEEKAKRFRLDTGVSENAGAEPIEEAGLDPEGDAIRAYSPSGKKNTDDYVELTPHIYFEDEEGTPLADADLTYSATGSESLIKGITWGGSNDKGFTWKSTNLNPQFDLYSTFASVRYDSTSANSVFLGRADEAQEITAVATITYLDGTKDQITKKINVAEPNYGYIAYPKVTLGALDAFNPAEITLENKTGSYKTASVSYEVYKIIDSSISMNDIAELDENDVQLWYETGYIEKVGSSKVSFKNLKKVINESDNTVGISGSNGSYTLTAEKVTQFKEFPCVVQGDFSCDGMPVYNSMIPVYVVASNPTATVTVSTDAVTPVAHVTDYDAPQLKTTSSWLSRTYGKTLGSTKKTPIAYVYSDVAIGTSLVLPVESDYDPKTFNTKKTLWCYEDDSGSYYAPGQTVKVSGDIEFTAVWVNKFENLQSGGTAGVTVVDADTKVPLSSTTVLGKGATKRVAISYNGIDTAARAEAVELGVLTATEIRTEDPTYTQEGLTLKVGSSEGSGNGNGFTFSGAAITATADAPTGSPSTMSFKFTDPDHATSENPAIYDTTSSDITVASTTVDLDPAKTYTITADAATTDIGASKKVAVSLTDDEDTNDPKTKIKFDDATYFASTNPADNVTVTVANKGIATATVDDTANTANIIVTGVNSGSTTMTISVRDINGNVSSTTTPVSITVESAKKKIEVTQAGKDAGQWDATAGILVKRGNTNEVVNVPLQLTTIASGSGTTGTATSWEFEDVTPDTVLGKETIIKSVSASTVSAGQVEITLSGKAGYGRIKATMTDGDNVYTAELPVTTAWTYTYTVQTASEEADPNNGFKVYDGTTVATAAKDIARTIIYNGSNSYTVPGSDKLTAVWNKTGAKDFIGWKTGSASTTATIADVEYESGEVYTIDKEDLGTSGTTFYTAFGEPLIEVAGLPTSITLTDETLADGTVAGTDAKKYVLSITPATSAATVTIGADDTGMIELDGGDATKKKSASRKAYNSSADNISNSTASTSGARTITITVGKKDNTVGETALVVTYNGIDKRIPIYLNGECQDGTDPNVYHYMENGSLLEAGMRTVQGEAHYYSDYKKVLNGVIKLDSGPDAGKIILVLGGVVDTTPGNVAIGTDVYYVGRDGFVKNSGLFTGETTTDANVSYYANEDGKLVKGEIKEINGKKYYFNGAGAMEKAPATANLYALTSDGKYFVSTTGEVAIAGLFTVEGKQYLADDKGAKVTYAMTQAAGTPGKYTVAGVGYVIAEDDTAKLDDILYDPTVKFAWPSAYTKGTTMSITWSGTVKSKNNGGKTQEISGTATVTPSTVSAGNLEKKIEFAATADLSMYWTDDKMSAKAADKTEKKTYSFKNGGPEGKQGDYNFDDDAEEDGTLTVVFAETGDKTLETPYTGYPIKPQVIVTNGDRTLVEGVDYSVSYKNNTNVKNKEATKAVVKGKGKYSDTIDMPFTIAPVDLASDEVVVGGTVFKSNVADKNIKPVVTYKGKIRTLNKDYAISLGSWTAAEKESFATLTLSAGTNGNFTGTKEVGVTKMDNPPKVKVTKFTAPAATYRGEDEPWVLTSENLTMQGVDAADFDEKVNLTYSNNVNAGTCKVTITVEGQSGKATKSFKIKPNTTEKLVATNGQDLKDTGVKYVNTGAQPYVAVAVDSASDSTLAGTELVYGRDYTLKWSNNKKVAKAGDSKAPMYKITYLGNYKGNTTLKQDTFTINQTILADNEVVVKMPETLVLGTTNKASKYFLTVGKNLVVTVNGVVLKKSEFIVEFFKEGTETALTKNDTVAAGDKIGVRIIPKGAKMTALYGDKAYTAPDTYEIVDKGSKKDLGKNKIKFLQPNGSKEKTASIGYTGVAITLDLNKLASEDPKQAFIAMYDGKEKVELNETDYKIEYANNVNKGTATVIITATDSNEKYAGSVAANFKIKSGSVKTIEVKE